MNDVVSRMAGIDGYERSRFRRLANKLAVLCLSAAYTFAAGSAALAAPQGGTVVGGQGLISQPNASTTQIDQQSNRLAIDWQSFNVGTAETVNFAQPSSTAIALNRIHDQNPSQIFGAINANGQVILSNANGLFFSQTASVNVAGLIATSLDLAPNDFLSGGFDLSAPDGGQGGLIHNQGVIETLPGGFVVLAGGAVLNEGVIIADLGSIELAAGRSATVDFAGDGLLMFEVDAAVEDNVAAVESAVANSGDLIAAGGRVLLTANAARDVFTNAINNSGAVRAARIDNSGGVVRLVGAGGDTLHSGVIDASAGDDASTGGFVEVLGDRVGIFDSAIVDASGSTGGGEVLIGGDFQGSNPEIKNSNMTVVAADAAIAANAGTSGDGGKVIVWSDGQTNYYGSIEARGGNAGGDGGLVEVSGKTGLAYLGSSDVGAPAGEGGTLLLDPATINVVAAAGTATPPVLFADNPGGNDVVDVADINTAAAGSTVVLQATDDITISAQVNIASDANLVFQAGDAITQAAGNDIITNGGDIHLEADSPHSPVGGNDGIGGIDMVDALNLIASNGGDITLIGDFIQIASDPSGGVDAGSGNVTFSRTALQDLALGGPLMAQFRTTTGTLTFGEAVTAGPSGLGGNVGTDPSLGPVLVTVNNLTMSASSYAANLTLVAGNDIGITGAINMSDGLTVLQARNNIIINSSITSNNSLAAQAGENINVTDNIDLDNNGGVGDPNLQLEADSIHAAANGADNSGTLSIGPITVSVVEDNGLGGDVTLIAADFAIDPNSIFASVGTFDVSVSTSKALVVGATAGTLINQAEFSSFNVPTVEWLRFGRALTAGTDGAGTGAIAVAPSSILVQNLTIGPDGIFGVDFNSPGDATFENVSIDTAGVGVEVDDNAFPGNGIHTLKVGAVTAVNGGDVLYTGTGGDDVLESTAAIGSTFTWNDNGEGFSADLDGFSFFTFGTVRGSGVDDNFVVNTDGTGTTQVIDGGGGTDKLDYSGASLTSDVVLTNAGPPFSGTARDVPSFSNLEGVTGAGVGDILTGADTTNIWTLSSAGAGSINGFSFSAIVGLTGGSLNDTLVGTSGPDTWSISGGGGSVASTSFGNFEAFDGGAGADIFDFAGPTTAAIKGGAGADTFNLTQQVATLDGGDDGDTFFFQGGNTTGLIDGGTGGTGDDILDYSGRTAGAIGITLTSATNGSGTDIGPSGFININGVVGSPSSSDSFTGSATGTNINPNVWTFEGLATDNVDGFAFENMELFTGGAGVDEFTLGTDLTTALDGGDGDDMFMVEVTQTSDILGNDGSDTFMLTEGATAASLDGGTGVTDSDTLVADDGGANTANSWDIATGTLVQGSSAQSFANMENLQGDGSVDTFDLNGAVAGAVMGMGGDDVFNVSANIGGDIDGGAGSEMFEILANQTGDISGGADNDTFMLTEGVTAATLDGGTGGVDSDTLIADDGGADTANTWDVGAGTLDQGGSVQSFANMENLQGDGSADTFVVAEGSSVAAVDGGSAGNANALVADDGGANTANTWDVAAGTLDQGGSMQSFANIDSLEGDGSADTFELNGSVAGAVMGMAGSDTFMLTEGATAASLDGGTDSDTLVADDGGANTANSWNIAATGTLVQGSSAQSFANMENLQGDGSADTFDLNGAVAGSVMGMGGDDVFNISANIGGTIDGGAGSEMFEIMASQTGDISGGADNDTFMLTEGATTGSLDGGTGGNDSDTLIADDGGADTANTWDVGAGTLDQGGTVQLFSNMENLQGDGSADTFLVAEGSSVAAVDGGSAGNVNTLVADDGGANTANTWDVAAGTLDQGGSMQSFANIDSLEGDGSADTFELNGSVAGAVMGMAGSDTFMLTEGVTAASLDGGTGGTDSDTLLAADGGTNTANSWNIATGTLVQGSSAQSFANIENLQGDGSVDTFDLNGAVVGSVMGMGGDDVFMFHQGGSAGGDAVGGEGSGDVLDYSALSSGIVATLTAGSDAGAGTATAIGGAFSGMDRLVGGASNEDELNGANADRSWSLATNSDVNGFGFDGIEVVNGGSASDTVELNAIPTATTFEFDGGAGSDFINIASNIDDYQGNLTLTADTIDVDAALSFSGSADAMINADGTNTLTLNNVLTLLGNAKVELVSSGGVFFNNPSGSTVAQATLFDNSTLLIAGTEYAGVQDGELALVFANNTGNGEAIEINIDKLEAGTTIVVQSLSGGYICVSTPCQQSQIRIVEPLLIGNDLLTIAQTAIQDEVEIDWLAYSPDLRLFQVVNDPGVLLPENQRLDEFASRGLRRELFVLAERWRESLGF